jgi:hypothetical protein
LIDKEAIFSPSAFARGYGEAHPLSATSRQLFKESLTFFTGFEKRFEAEGRGFYE